jgi:hypothetical protein
MTIRDRDGNIYKLKGPNPIMNTQNSWDHNKIIVHNMQFPLIIHRDQKQLINENIAIEECHPAEFVLPKLDTNRTQKLNNLLEERKIKLLCLPAKKQDFSDALYGTTYSRTQFGEKTSITGVAISSNDLMFVFWTEYVIEVKSIVYPTQTEMKRWWQVDKCELQAGGFLVSCSPSTISPDFSD